MKTDLQRFKDFFDEMGIEYRIEVSDYVDIKTIIIDKGYLSEGDYSSLSIDFNKYTENFIEFLPFGD